MLIFLMLSIRQRYIVYSLLSVVSMVLVLSRTRINNIYYLFFLVFYPSNLSAERVKESEQ